MCVVRSEVTVQFFKHVLVLRQGLSLGPEALWDLEAGSPRLPLSLEFWTSNLDP